MRRVNTAGRLPLFAPKQDPKIKVSTQKDLMKKEENNTY